MGGQYFNQDLNSGFGPSLGFVPALYTPRYERSPVCIAGKGTRAFLPVRTLGALWPGKV
jgi:hypothetical protein